jgi:hypothetical protein
MHHFNVCLRDAIYEFCRILRIDQANVNYVRTKKAGDPHFNHTLCRLKLSFLTVMSWKSSTNSVSPVAAWRCRVKLLQLHTPSWP